jgi:hypothetical protein
MTAGDLGMLLRWWGGGGCMRIPEQAAHDSGMMPPIHSEIMPPTVPR